MDAECQSSHLNFVQLARTYNAVLLMDCTYKNNGFHMKLFDVAGITSFNTTFYIGLTEECNAWALENVKSLYSGISYSPVIAIDRDLALVNVVRHVFPNSPILLCTWRGNKNIAKNCKSIFETGKRYDYFFKQWELVLYAGTLGEFE